MYLERIFVVDLFFVLFFVLDFFRAAYVLFAGVLEAVTHKTRQCNFENVPLKW